MRTSLVVQWLIIPLPMWGTWVQSLVGEDFTCLEATKPVCQLALLKTACPRARTSQQKKPSQKVHAQQLESNPAHH